MENNTENIDSINLFNINLEDEDTDMACIICHESLDVYQKYKLPECHHEFHIHCIVTWFRNGDSSCPYCRNKGINYEKKPCKKYWWRQSNESAIFKELKKLSHQDNAPTILVKEFDKLNQLNDKYKIVKNIFDDFKESLKTEELIYNEAHKKKYKLRCSKFSAERAIRRQQNIIINLPIIPLIIPIPIDIN